MSNPYEAFQFTLHPDATNLEEPRPDVKRAIDAALTAERYSVTAHNLRLAGALRKERRRVGYQDTDPQMHLAEIDHALSGDGVAPYRELLDAVSRVIRWVSCNIAFDERGDTVFVKGGISDTPKAAKAILDLHHAWAAITLEEKR